MNSGTLSLIPLDSGSPLKVHDQDERKTFCLDEERKMRNPACFEIQTDVIKTIFLKFNSWIYMTVFCGTQKEKSVGFFLFLY